MPGVGRPPKENRQNPHDKPGRGEWKAAEGTGWQHEPVKAPAGLLKASREAWDTWMKAWFAAFWTPDDLPGLRVLVRIYDEVERGEFQRAAELRLQMDNYGITPKGQQDRRWKKPVSKDPAATTKGATSGRYGHLRDVSNA